MSTAMDGLSAELRRLDLLAELDDDSLASLRESGVLDRTYVDTVENVVSLVEVYAERTFGEQADDAHAILKGKGKVLQRLADFADLFSKHLGSDPRPDIGGDGNLWVPETRS